jgi:uncharacterized membrane protein
MLLFRKPGSNDNNDSSDADDSPWFYAVSAAMVTGIVGTAIYSFAEKSWSVFACAVLVGLAASSVGALAGFVFGIPKTGTTPGMSAAYEGNTNLEQISDWLTKILVGAGLVELKGPSSVLSSFASAFRENQALGSHGWIVAPGIAIAYAVCGFLLAYLWARIYMIAELEERRSRTSVTTVEATITKPNP